jgi:hypothetical protein
VTKSRKDCRWILDGAKKPMSQGSCTPHKLRPFIDYDYIESLSEEDQKWLARFTDYYYTGARNEVSKDLDQKDFRDSYNRNNARNRSIDDKTLLLDDNKIRVSKSKYEEDERIFEIDTQDLSPEEILDYLNNSSND